MFNRKELFRKVAIVGVGLMGASLGLAVKKKGLAREVVGIGRQEASLKEAKALGAIDEGSLDFNKGTVGADLIVLATPVNTILDLIETLGREHRRGCIITDLGSTKSAVVERAEKVLPHSLLFVGSHPLVGSEKRGPGAANAQLYEGGVCVMTPTERTNRLAREKVKQFWTQLGSSVKIMSPEEHDQVLAHVSHLPHLMAFALMKAIPDNFLDCAPQGLKDATRIAASDPVVWRDIALTNHKPVLRALDEAVKVLASMRKAIVGRDAEALTDIFKTAKEKRRRLG
ncbi:MAG: prephenate dehydrogenase [Candidatus Omnitrophica bacterium]|nr:prephenate dehydrogenase [Candidatus Omnitrophota bacterium]MDE2214976.1 prephenate dehydrogenase [Candidatus Omnitrophota bacterium]